MSCCIGQRNMLAYAMNHIEGLDLKAHAEAMHEIEHGADELKREMTGRLLREFIPAIERDDLLTMANLMELAIDGMEEIMKAIRIHDIRHFDETARQFMDILSRCVDALACVITQLREFKTGERINECIEAVKTVEREGDVLYLEALTALYAERSPDIYDVLARNALIEAFEMALNACEKVAHYVEVVRIKNI